MAAGWSLGAGAGRPGGAGRAPRAMQIAELLCQPQSVAARRSVWRTRKATNLAIFSIFAFLNVKPLKVLLSFLPFFRAETNRFPDDPGAGPGDVGNSYGPWRTQTFLLSSMPFFRAETNRFPGDPGAGPGDVPDIFLTFLAIDKNCSSQSASARRPGAGMQQPRAGAAVRDAGAAAGVGAPPSGAPAASGCAAFAGGVVRPPAARRVRAVVPHTAHVGRRRPATCVCAFRPLRMCARSLLA